MFELHATLQFRQLLGLLSERLYKAFPIYEMYSFAKISNWQKDVTFASISWR